MDGKNANIKDFNSAVRVGVFVDVQNMYYSAKNLFNSKLNYGKLLPFIANGRTIVTANAFILSKTDIKTTDFTDMLYDNGFDLFKKFMEFKTRKNQVTGVESQYNTVSWEIGIVLEMIKWADKLDCIALVSGNGNYIDAVRYMKNKCRVEVFSFEDSTASLLKRDASDFIALDTVEDEDEGESLLIPMKENNGIKETPDPEGATEDEDIGNKK
jgi:uncharacterized LabA/DUF88 family protein